MNLNYTVEKENVEYRSENRFFSDPYKMEVGDIVCGCITQTIKMSVKEESVSFKLYHPYSIERHTSEYYNLRIVNDYHNNRVESSYGFEDEFYHRFFESIFSLYNNYEEKRIYNTLEVVLLEIHKYNSRYINTYLGKMFNDILYILCSIKNTARYAVKRMSNLHTDYTNYSIEFDIISHKNGSDRHCSITLPSDTKIYSPLSDVILRYEIASTTHRVPIVQSELDIMWNETESNVQSIPLYENSNIDYLKLDYVASKIVL